MDIPSNKPSYQSVDPVSGQDDLYSMMGYDVEQTDPAANSTREEIVSKTENYFKKHFEEIQGEFSESNDFQMVKVPKEKAGVAGLRIIKSEGVIKDYIVKVKSAPIGSEGFKNVYNVMNRAGEDLAMIKPKKLDTEIEQREIDNMLKFRDTKGVAGGWVVQSRDGDKRVVMQKYYNGNGLKDTLKKRPLLNSEKMTVFKDALTGLANMHQEGYAHFDVSSDNILIKIEEEEVKEAVLGDLGFSGDQKNIPPNYRPDHAPPELLSWVIGGKKGEFAESCDAEKWDVWSLGCVIYEMHYGKQLEHFELNRKNANLPQKDQIGRYGRKIPSMRIEKPNEKNTIDWLIWRMLQQDPSKRISAREAKDKLEKLGNAPPDAVFSRSLKVSYDI